MVRCSAVLILGLNIKGLIFSVQWQLYTVGHKNVPVFCSAQLRYLVTGVKMRQNE